MKLKKAPSKNQSQIGEYLRTCPSLLTKANIKLFDELEKMEAVAKKNQEPSTRYNREGNKLHQKRLKIVGAFKVPAGYHNSEEELLDSLMGNLKWAAIRFRAIEERELQEGMTVTLDTDTTKIPWLIKKIKDDGLLQLEDYPIRVSPQEVQVIA